MNMNIFAAILLLIFHNAYSQFDCDPKTITPNVTPEFKLLCKPEIDPANMILAVHIMKKSDNTPREVSQISEESHDEQQQKQNAEEQKENQPDIPGENDTRQEDLQDGMPDFDKLPKYDPSFNGYFKKRSIEDDFVRATLTVGNITIVPTNDRFKSEGELGKPSHLSVTFLRPGVSDLGMYECQATFYDFATQSIKTSSITTHVQEVVELKLSDLALRMSQLEESCNSYEVVTKEMPRVLQEMKFINKFMETDLNSMKNDIQQMRDDLTEVFSQLKDLKANALAKENNGTTIIGGENTEYTTTSNDNDLRNTEQSARNGIVTSNHFLALVKQTMELKKSSMSTQERMTVMELMIRGTIERRFRVLESFNWQAISESVQEIEMKEIPMLKKDVLECKQEQKLLHSEGVVNESNTANEVPVSPLSIQITEANIPEDATTVKTPAETTTTQAPIVTTTEINPEFGCYVCGNNLTEEHCPIEKVNIKMACPKYKPFCITDIHQNGFTRHVYKRCASERDCKNGNANSDPSCETDIFVTAEAKQCHFCCTSKFCNENLRPTTDIYTKQ